MSPKVQQHRASSFELGDPSLTQQFNKQTGRPIRRGAGRKKSAAGYVDSVVIEEDGDPIELPSEDEDGLIKPVRKKRKRTPSPSPPPLDSIIYDEEEDVPSDDESEGKFHHHMPHAAPVTLQFNIPLGFHGPLMVKLDRSLMEAIDPKPKEMLPTRKTKRKVHTSTAKSGKAQLGGDRKGFTDLPPELRNNVYRLLFNTHKDFNFGSPYNFARSAQFLRTCRLVHSEGCSVLYGESQFIFERNRSTRAPFWDPRPKEIGYKDIRQFLKMIGPENLAYLRDIKLTLEDATPASTPYLNSQDERRYINDEQLIECLRILSQARLRHLAITFYGRRSLMRSDVRFLGHLEQLKADEVTSPELSRWYMSNKVPHSLWEQLKDSMTRQKKLYAKK